MARFSANAAGEIIEFKASGLAERLAPLPPAGAAFSLHFDEVTNPGLITSYQADPQAYSMPGGTLTVSGVPATVNDPGAYDAARSRAGALLVKLRDTTDPFTREDIADALAIAFHADGLPSS